ncbi:hypothetical protein [Vibrio crassostreae]|uniref:hypothetical protein n=1 Tax=Vibrio crassostreae TaxID=246167 RepID=UPI001B3135E7|nr:hypothetical protein [Vibrio crassostreae]
MKVNTPEQRAAKRSRRLRKKLYLGEFAENCTLITSTLTNPLLLESGKLTDEQIDAICDVIDEVCDIAEKHSAYIGTACSSKNKFKLYLITSVNHENVEPITEEIASLESLCDSTVFKAVDANYSEVWDLDDPDEGFEPL